MTSLLPNKDELREQAVEGRPITQTEASTIASAESELTGLGPIKGGSAATAQSLHDKQQNFVAKAGDVARKPANEITKEDAAQVQSAEVGHSSSIVREATQKVQNSNSCGDRHAYWEDARQRGPRQLMCSPSPTRMQRSRTDEVAGGKRKSVAEFKRTIR